MKTERLVMAFSFTNSPFMPPPMLISSTAAYGGIGGHAFCFALPSPLGYKQLSDTRLLNNPASTDSIAKL